MNEIPKVAVAPLPIKAVMVSSSGVKRQNGGNDLPPAVKAANHQHVHVRKMQENVEAAVKQMNEYIQSTQRDLKFSYDKLSGETVVKVLDRGSQQVIRQIPDEAFLKLVRARDYEGYFHLLNAHA